MSEEAKPECFYCKRPLASSFKSLTKWAILSCDREGCEKAYYDDALNRGDQLVTYVNRKSQ